MKCCICKKEFHGYGNNPWGAAWKTDKGEVELLEDFAPTDVCCDECNKSYVLPGRIYRAKINEALKTQKESEEKRDQ